MQYTMMQLMRDADGTFTCHVTRRSDDRDAAPHIRSYRRISADSVCRFFELSGGYFTTYSEKPPRREHELPY